MEYICTLIAELDFSNRQFRAYALICLGVQILTYIGTDILKVDDPNNEAIVCLDKACQNLDRVHGVKALVAKFELLKNVIAYAVVMASYYNMNFSPEKALFHDWSLTAPFFIQICSFKSKNIYLYVALFKTISHYMKTFFPDVSVEEKS